MKQQLPTIIVTTLITALVLVGGLFALMPILGPAVLHPLMMGSGSTPHMMMPPSASTPATALDTATTRLTDNGLYRVSFVSALDPIGINQIHSWTVTVTTPAGEPVEQATITVDGGMPQHGHGLPTRPRITQNLGQGNYLLEGLRFQMPGWWEVSLTITAGDQTDRVTFNLELP